MGLLGSIGDAVSDVGKKVGGAAKKVSHTAGKVVNKANDVAGDVIKGGSNVVGGVTKAAGSVVPGDAGKAIRSAGQRVQAGGKAIDRGLDRVGRKLETGINRAGKTLDRGIRTVGNKAEKTANGFEDAVEKGVEGLTQGKGGLECLGNVASNVWDKVKEGAKKYGPDVLKIGAVVGASALGFAVGGPAGAAVGGALAGGAVSAIDQKIRTGKIDPLKVGVNAGLGAIPGAGGALGKIGGSIGSKVLSTSGGSVLKGAGQKVASGVAGRLPGRVPGALTGAATKGDVAKGGLTRAFDNGQAGFLFGAGNTVYDGVKQGQVNWKNALINGGRSAAAGVASGVVVGGVAGRFGKGPVAETPPSAAKASLPRTKSELVENIDPAEVALETSDQIGKRVLLHQLQQTNFLA